MWLLSGSPRPRQRGSRAGRARCARGSELERGGRLRLFGQSPEFGDFDHDGTDEAGFRERSVGGPVLPGGERAMGAVEAGEEEPEQCHNRVDRIVYTAFVYTESVLDGLASFDWGMCTTPGTLPGTVFCLRRPRRQSGGATSSSRLLQEGARNAGSCSPRRRRGGLSSWCSRSAGSGSAP